MGLNFGETQHTSSAIEPDHRSVSHLADIASRVNWGALGTLRIGAPVRAQCAPLCHRGARMRVRCQGRSAPKVTPGTTYLSGNVSYPCDSSKTGPPSNGGPCMCCSRRAEAVRSSSRLALSDPYQFPVIGKGIGEVERRDVDVAPRYPLPFGPRPSGFVLTTRSQTHSIAVWNRRCEESRDTRRAAFGV